MFLRFGRGGFGPWEHKQTPHSMCLQWQCHSRTPHCACVSLAHATSVQPLAGGLVGLSHDWVIMRRCLAVVFPRGWRGQCAGRWLIRLNEAVDRVVGQPPPPSPCLLSLGWFAFSRFRPSFCFPCNSFAFVRQLQPNEGPLGLSGGQLFQAWQLNEPCTSDNDTPTQGQPATEEEPWSHTHTHTLTHSLTHSLVIQTSTCNSTHLPKFLG